MKSIKAGIKKDIKISIKTIREKLKAIEINMMNKYPDPNYAHEKMSIIRNETRKIEDYFIKMNRRIEDYM